MSDTSTDGTERNVLTDCDGCGILLKHGENNEYGHGTYCDDCSLGIEGRPMNADSKRVVCPSCGGTGAICDGDDVGLCEGCMGAGDVPNRSIDTDTERSEVSRDE